jgi:hypothetical protein
MTHPFRTAIDEHGCPHCGGGRTWRVVWEHDGQEWQSSTSYSDEEAAEHEARCMAVAYQMGREDAAAKHGADPRKEA